MENYLSLVCPVRARHFWIDLVACTVQSPGLPLASSVGAVSSEAELSPPPTDPGGRRHHHRQGHRQDQSAGAGLLARARLRRHGAADALRAVSRGRAAEAEGGGAHGDAARDRRHQQPHAGLPRALLRSVPAAGLRCATLVSCVVVC